MSDDYDVFFPLEAIGADGKVYDSVAGQAGDVVGCTITDAWIGKGLAFTGADDERVQLADTGIVGGRSQLTCSMWVKFHSTANDHDLIVLGKHAGSNPLVLWNDAGTSGQLALLITDDAGNYTGVSYGAAPALDQFHHVALTYNAGGYARVYLNGTQTIEIDVSGYSAIASETHLQLGANHPDENHNELDGVLDHVKFFYRELSASEIAALADEKERILAGAVEGQTAGSTIAATLRAYRESDGAFVGENVLDGSTDDSYQITTPHSGPHTIVALPPDGSGLPPQVLRNVTPVEQ